MNAATASTLVVYCFVLRDVPKNVQGKPCNRMQETTKALPVLFAFHDDKNRRQRGENPHTPGGKVVRKWYPGGK